MTSDDPVGKTLAEADPALFDEISALLKRGSLSGAAHLISDSERATLLKTLPKARIRRRCPCKDRLCSTCDSNVSQKGKSVAYHTVRFCERAEALLHIDSEYDFYAFERLYDEGPPTTRYVLQRDGTWQVVEDS